MQDNDALAMLQAVYRNSQIPLSTRMRAAIAALAFEKPKLSAMAIASAGDLADQLMRALQASQKVINSRPVQVIEPPKVIEHRVEEPLDHSKPFAADNKSRFRRF